MRLLLFSPKPSAGERGWLFPSPTGRRWRAAPDEGTGAAACTQLRESLSLRTLTPTPLPRGEGLCTWLFLLPPGEGAPKGRMRVRAQASYTQLCESLSRRTLSPTPLPRGEGTRIMDQPDKLRQCSTTNCTASPPR
ncbi:hypothetical protein XhyaCFBP1156_19210 [Xanthomonas hyacinthi]|uniref:Uncharacterized protein n=1 Tax=Xanthomonas hyacinthi TaxID=56455 RepID=A0A2S7EQA2_9XANT|nr:hypothetical protein XhyaCFBP1156_19210 [Xanthomonas hyacinthi]